MTPDGTVINDYRRQANILTQVNGIEDMTVGIIVFLLFLRIINIIRVAKDVTARTNSLLVQVLSILFVTLLTPLIGLPIYFVIRPIAYKKDSIPRREACASNLIVCYNCQTLNAKEHTCCIECGESLTNSCKECRHDYPHMYQYCPSCGAPNLNVA